MEINQLLEQSTTQRQRYYIDDSTNCKFCRKPGHVVKDCPEKSSACHLCKKDHDPSRCILMEICFHCYRRGHPKNKCPLFLKGVPKNCQYCERKGHSTMDCDLVWRKYLMKVWMLVKLGPSGS
jgi:hypothetical protein